MYEFLEHSVRVESEPLPYPQREQGHVPKDPRHVVLFKMKLPSLLKCMECVRFISLMNQKLSCV